MIKFKFLINYMLCLIFSCSVLNATTDLEIGLSESFEEVEKRAAQFYPSQFIGMHNFDVSIVPVIRKMYAEHGSASLTIPCPELKPFARKFLNYIKHENPNFLNPYSSDLESDAPTIENIFKGLLSGTLALDHLSSDEVDLFKSVLNPPAAGQLMKEGKWSEDLSQFLKLVIGDQASYEGDEPFRISAKKIEEMVQRDYPVPVFYLMPGQGKMGVSFMVRGLLRNIFPIGFPSKILSAHGVKLGQGSFAIHDLLHAHYDPRIKKLAKHISMKMDEYAAQGGNPYDFIEIYAPNAIQKQIRLWNALETIYQDFVSALVQDKNKKDYAKIMNGFFLMLHEHFVIPKEIYDLEDLSEIIKCLTQASIDKLYDSESWESAEDPFETSPLDGKPALSEMEIYEFFKSKHVDLKSLEQYGIYNSQIQALDSSYQHSWTVRRTESNRFIEVNNKFEKRSLDQISIHEQIKFFPTLYHKFSNTADLRGLLKLSGVSIVEPVLEGAPNPRALVQEYLLQLQTEARSQIEYFRDRAIAFATLQRQNGESLVSDYANWDKTQKARVIQQLESLLPN